MFGRTSRTPLDRLVQRGRLLFQRLPSRSRSAAASASSADVSAPVRLPCPTSRDSALRRACFSCSAVSAARRSASCARISDDTDAQSAPRKRGIEAGRIAADGADIMHRHHTSTGFGSTSFAAKMEIS